MSLTKRCINEGIKLVDSRDMLASEVLDLEKQLQSCEEQLRLRDRLSLRRRTEGLRRLLDEKYAELRRMNSLVQADTQPTQPPAVGDLVRASNRIVEVVDVLDSSLRCRIPPEHRQEGDDRAAFIITGHVEIVQRWEDRPRLTRPENPRRAEKAEPQPSGGGQLGLF